MTVRCMQSTKLSIGIRARIQTVCDVVAGGTKLGGGTSHDEWRRDAAIGRKRGRAAMDTLTDTLVTSNVRPAQALAAARTEHDGDQTPPAVDLTPDLALGAVHEGIAAAPDCSAPGGTSDQPAPTAHAHAGAASSTALPAPNGADAAAAGGPGEPQRSDGSGADTTALASQADTAERRRAVEALLDEAHPDAAVRGSRRGVVGGGLRASRTGAFDAAEARAISARMDAAAAAWNAASRDQPAAPVYKV